MADLPNPAPSAPPRRRRLFGFGFWAVLVFSFACVVGGYWLAQYGPQVFPPRDDSPHAANREAGGATLALPPAPMISTQRLEASPSAPPDAANIAPTELAPRVAALEASQIALADAVAAGLAADALSQAAERGAPFAAEATQVAQALPASAEAHALLPLAAVGAPSRTALAGEFESLIQPVAIAVQAPPANAGPLERIGYAFSSIVTVRRVSEDAAGRLPALARIERQVAGGDLEAALAGVGGLSGAARDRLTPWRIRAERRVRIDTLVAAVRTQALARLQRARPTPQAPALAVQTAPQAPAAPVLPPAAVPPPLPLLSPAPGPAQDPAT